MEPETTCCRRGGEVRRRCRWPVPLLPTIKTLTRSSLFSTAAADDLAASAYPGYCSLPSRASRRRAGRETVRIGYHAQHLGERETVHDTAAGSMLGGVLGTDEAVGERVGDLLLGYVLPPAISGMGPLRRV